MAHRSTPGHTPAPVAALSTLPTPHRPASCQPSMPALSPQHQTHAPSHQTSEHQPGCRAGCRLCYRVADSILVTPTQCSLLPIVRLLASRGTHPSACTGQPPLSPRTQVAGCRVGCRVTCRALFPTFPPPYGRSDTAVGGILADPYCNNLDSYVLMYSTWFASLYTLTILLPTL